MPDTTTPAIVADELVKVHRGRGRRTDVRALAFTCAVRSIGACQRSI
ncbi:MAG: hypothetical protein ABWY55_07345 [Microbacterium sp.]